MLLARHKVLLAFFNKLLSDRLSISLGAIQFGYQLVGCLKLFHCSLCIRCLC